MTDVKLARRRIVPGREDRIRDWYAELSRRESEVVETLEHEGVATETAFVRSAGDASYLYVYMEAADVARAEAAGDAERYDVDAEHHAVLRECLTGDWEELDVVGHFTNPAQR